MKETNKKKVSTATAVVLMAAMLFTGTWAWSSINQDAYNQGVEKHLAGARLHQDFFLTTDKNSDIRSDASVYVENYMRTGDSPIITRVMIREYLESGSFAGLEIDKTTADRKEDARTSADGVKSLNVVASGMEINDPSTWRIHKFGETAEDNPIRSYLNFKYGGQTVYMPTFNRVSEAVENWDVSVDSADQDLGAYDTVANFTKQLKDQPDINGTIYGTLTYNSAGPENAGTTIYDPTLAYADLQVLNNSTIDANQRDLADTDRDEIYNPSTSKKSNRYKDYVKYVEAVLTTPDAAGSTVPNSGLDVAEGNEPENMAGYVATDATLVTDSAKRSDLANADNKSYVNAVSQLLANQDAGATSGLYATVDADFKKVNTQEGKEYYLDPFTNKLVIADAVHYAKKTNAPVTGINGEDNLDQGVISMDQWNLNFAAYKQKKEELETAAAGAPLTSEQLAQLDVFKKKVIGSFWVYDKDGWAYYADALNPNSATSCLVNSLMGTTAFKDIDKWHYMMDVTMQCATTGDIGTKDDATNFYDPTKLDTKHMSQVKPSSEAETLLREIGAAVVNPIASARVAGYISETVEGTTTNYLEPTTSLRAEALDADGTIITEMTVHHDTEWIVTYNGGTIGEADYVINQMGVLSIPDGSSLIGADGPNGKVLKIKAKVTINGKEKTSPEITVKLRNYQ